MLQFRTTYRSLLIFIGVLIVFVPLMSCSTPGPGPVQVQFTPLSLGIPASALQAPVTGPLPDTTELHVRVTFKINPQVLAQAEQQKIQPGQRSHLEGIANKIGIDDGTYQKVKGFFQTQGLVLKLGKLRTHLAVNGKAKTFAKLFQTKFVVHSYHGRTFFAPATPPKVPSFLANYIDAITGLDNYSAPPRHDATIQPGHARSIPHHAQQDCTPLDRTLLPKDVAGAYGYDQFWNHGFHGENMTVNLVEIDGFYREDIQNYLDCIQFKGNVSIANVDSPPRDALGEATLDVQMIAGLARSVNINVYQTDGGASDDIWSSVNDMLQQIIDDNTNNANSGSTVSISLGAAEQEMTADDARAIDSSLQQLTRIEHITVFVASGDCGAFTDRNYGDLSVSFPASDPWVTAVGGTEMAVNNRHRAEEIAWSDGSQRSSCHNQWGSGGGNSEVFRAPDWQNAPGVRNRFSRGARQLPDVSAVAYALAVYFQGQWGAVGGTSAAAPIWATGMVLTNQVLINQRHTFAYGPQVFYRVATSGNGRNAYYDVTRGNNLYYPATPGWDFATGLGTPNLLDFYMALRGLL